MNWMRCQVPPIERAIALASEVLPTPGTSSIRRWPSAKRHTSARCTARACPGCTRSTLPRARASNTVRGTSVVGGWVPLEPTVCTLHLPLRRAPVRRAWRRAREPGRPDGTATCRDGSLRRRALLDERRVGPSLRRPPARGRPRSRQAGRLARPGWWRRAAVPARCPTATTCASASRPSTGPSRARARRPRRATCGGAGRGRGAGSAPVSSRRAMPPGEEVSSLGRALMLNASFEPLCVVSARRAVVLVLKEKAEIVARNGAELHSERMTVPVPTVIRLVHFVRVPFRTRVPLSRRAVFARDGHRCQYCSRPAENIDHVVPRSRGGEHTGRTWSRRAGRATPARRTGSSPRPTSCSAAARSRPTPPLWLSPPPAPSTPPGSPTSPTPTASPRSPTSARLSPPGTARSLADRSPRRDLASARPGRARRRARHAGPRPAVAEPARPNCARRPAPTGLLSARRPRTSRPTGVGRRRRSERSDGSQPQAARASPSSAWESASRRPSPPDFARRAWAVVELRPRRARVGSRRGGGGGGKWGEWV